jgi:hypothetical protein
VTTIFTMTMTAIMAVRAIAASLNAAPIPTPRGCGIQVKPDQGFRHRHQPHWSALFTQRRLTAFVGHLAARLTDLGAHLEHDALDGAPDCKITTRCAPCRHARQMRERGQFWYPRLPLVDPRPAKPQLRSR